MTAHAPVGILRLTAPKTTIARQRRARIGGARVHPRGHAAARAARVPHRLARSDPGAVARRRGGRPPHRAGGVHSRGRGCRAATAPTGSFARWSTSTRSTRIRSASRSSAVRPARACPEAGATLVVTVRTTCRAAAGPAGAGARSAREHPGRGIRGSEGVAILGVGVSMRACRGRASPSDPASRGRRRGERADPDARLRGARDRRDPRVRRRDEPVSRPEAPRCAGGCRGARGRGRLHSRRRRRRAGRRAHDRTACAIRPRRSSAMSEAVPWSRTPERPTACRRG